MPSTYDCILFFTSPKFVPEEALVVLYGMYCATKNDWLHQQRGAAHFSSHQYTSMAVVSDISASWTASPTGYCCAHICISSIHCCNVIRDFWEKLPSRTLALVLHCEHHQLYWSDTSLRGCSRIEMLHLCALNQVVVFKCTVFVTEKSLFVDKRSFLCRHVRMPSIPPNITSPISSSDIWHSEILAIAFN